MRPKCPWCGSRRTIGTLSPDARPHRCTKCGGGFQYGGNLPRSAPTTAPTHKDQHP